MDAFGKDAALDTMLHLHNECDAYGCRILKRFLEERNLKRIVQDIGLHRKKELSKCLTKHPCFSFKALTTNRRRQWSRLQPGSKKRGNHFA